MVQNLVSPGLSRRVDSTACWCWQKWKATEWFIFSPFLCGLHPVTPNGDQKFFLMIALCKQSISRIYSSTFFQLVINYGPVSVCQHLKKQNTNLLEQNSWHVSVLICILFLFFHSFSNLLLLATFLSLLLFPFFVCCHYYHHSGSCMGRPSGHEKQGHLTTVFYKISVLRNKYCLEFSITWKRLKTSRWQFHSCTIIEAYLINSRQFSEVWFFTFHSPG